MSVRVFTTGGTIDKVYFDAKSSFQVGEPQIGELLSEAGVSSPYSVTPLLRKDSLELDDADRALIAQRVAAAEETRMLITHGTDTLLETARYLAQHVCGRRVVLTGGASQLTGLADLFARQSKKSIGIGTPIGVAGLDENNSSSGYAASIGGLIHVSRLEDNDPDDRQTRTLPHGPFERIGAWLRDNL